MLEYQNSLRKAYDDYNDYDIWTQLELTLDVSVAHRLPKYLGLETIETQF